MCFHQFDIDSMHCWLFWTLVQCWIGNFMYKIFLFCHELSTTSLMPLELLYCAIQGLILCVKCWEVMKTKRLCQHDLLQVVSAVLYACYFYCVVLHTQNRLTALCPGLPEWAGTRRNIHPLTPFQIIRHPLSASSMYYDPQHPHCSIYMLDCTFPQPLSRFSLVYLFVYFILHTFLHQKFTTLFTAGAYSFHNSCPYHRSLFCCSTNVMSSVPNLSLSSLFGNLPFTLTPHIHTYRFIDMVSL